MGRIKFLVLLFVCVFSSASALAEVDFEELTQKVGRFVVKIDVSESQLFRPTGSRWHGSGFIVKISKNVGFIFTNRHVVEPTVYFHSLQVKLAFPTGDAQPETIMGEPIYVSPISDFAVVRFDPSKLKRARHWIKTAELASTPVEYARLFRQGREVLVYGHPLGSENVATPGKISARDIDLAGEEFPTRFLQVSAAINPGNSGGPLIDAETGLVIGINSAKDHGGEAMGFVLPINVVNAEYSIFTKNPDFAHPQRVLAFFVEMPGEVMKLDRTFAIIQSAEPDYFTKHSAALAVGRADPSSGLELNDVILRVNGEVLGSNRYDFYSRIQSAKKDTLRLTVLRKEKLIDVDVPIIRGPKQLPHTNDLSFVMISGLIMREIEPTLAWTMPGASNRDVNTSDLPRVILETLIPNAINEAYFDGQRFTLIQEVQFADQTFPIRRLVDLKKAIEAAIAAKQSSIRLIHSTPIVNEAQADIVRDGVTGRPVYHSPTTTILPIFEFITSDDVRMKEFQHGYDVAGRNPASTDWRTWMTPECRARVTTLAAESTALRE